MLSPILSKAGIGLAALMVFGGIEALPSLVGGDTGPSRNASAMTTQDPIVHRAQHETFSSGSILSSAKLNDSASRRPSLLDQVLSGAGCDYSAGAADRAVIGDHITVRVFEHAENNGERFERRDLSGTFTVGFTGEFAVPGIGRMTASGKPLTCLEGSIVSAFESEMNISTTVTASFAERPPVLIKGEVISPGSYDHTPELTVGTLLGKSGVGGSVADAALRRTLDARRDELRALRAGLVLRHKRLSAQRAGEETFSLLDRAAEAVNREIGADRIDSEIAVLRAASNEQAMRSARDAALRSNLESALKLALSRRNLVSERYAELSRKRDALEFDAAKECRGRCSPNRQFAELRLDSLNDRVADMDLILQDAETRVIEARHALERHDRNIKLERAEANSVLALSIVDSLVERNTIEAQIASVEDQLSTLGGTIDRFVTVHRQNGEEIQIFEAFDTMRLLPGDVVTVGTPDDARVVFAERASQ